MLGANLKMRYEKQFTKSGTLSSIPGVDLGVYVNPLDNYRDLIGDLGLSLSVQDIVPTKVSWTATLDSAGDATRNSSPTGPGRVFAGQGSTITSWPMSKWLSIMPSSAS